MPNENRHVPTPANLHTRMLALVSLVPPTVPTDRVSRYIAAVVGSPVDAVGRMISGTRTVSEETLERWEVRMRNVRVPATERVNVLTNGSPTIIPATVRGERRGRRILDIGGGPLLVEGEDCEVVHERE